MNQFDVKLYKSLINTEFFLNSNERAKGKNVFNNLSFFNIFSQLKNIKQFIKLLKISKSLGVKDFLIVINNKYLYYFVIIFLKKYSFTKRIKVQSFISNKIKPTHFNSSRLVLYLGSNSNPENLMRKLLSLNFLIVTTFSKNQSVKFNYHVPVKIFDLKKILFILIILTQVLNTK